MPTFHAIMEATMTTRAMDEFETGEAPAGPLDMGRQARFGIGQVVRHRIHPFRGVIFDVDAEFSNTDEWWEAIPEDNRPSKDQPFYHLLAENETSYYHAYGSEQNLLPDEDPAPLRHPKIAEMFERNTDGGFRAKFMQPN